MSSRHVECRTFVQAGTVVHGAPGHLASKQLGTRKLGENERGTGLEHFDWVGRSEYRVGTERGNAELLYHPTETRPVAKKRAPNITD